MGDRTRRTLLARLQYGPRSVTELSAGLDVGRPAVSQHLRVLKSAGLVVDHAVGTRRLYELDPDGLGAAQQYITRLWSAALHSFGDTIHTAEDDSEPGGLA